MRRAAGLVFDEYVATDPEEVVSYTSTELNVLLATADQMAIQVVVDGIAVPGATAPTSPRVWVRVQTSADGTSWAYKNTSPEVAPFEVPPGSTTVSPFSCDPGVLPTLCFARLEVGFLTKIGQAEAHIRVYVTLRDGGDVHEVSTRQIWMPGSYTETLAGPDLPPITFSPGP
jgi:hypothetical protein